MNFNQNLTNTNKIISDLDLKITTRITSDIDKEDDTVNYLSPESFKNNLRQFSNVSNSSSTYSNQTHQSSTSQASHLSNSSVIHNPSSNISANSNFKSNVLDYIKNNDSQFNPNELFQQRQQHQQNSFITKFDNPDKDFNQPVIGKIPDLPENPDDTYINDNDLNDNDVNDDEKLNLDQSSPIEGKKSGSIFFDDDYENDYDYDYENDDYNDDDLPSPPRSPPKEIDPDKLYGLYDFSGPDPSHCSISRDEPVYLINDQDNYWWLIKKMSKQERIQLIKARKLNESDQDLKNSDDDYLSTDEEDSKVGFVPAECLETYGERLARLNCFKNEELEKSSKDLIISNPSSSDNFNEPVNNKSDSSFGLGSPVNFQKTPDTTLSRSGSILKDGTKQQINKSVTFEDLGELEMNEESDDNEEEFPTHYNIPEIEEIHNEIQNNQMDEEERRSEILSEVYPSETPLVINKRKSVSDSPSPTKESDFRKSDSVELDSNVAYSPTTPQSNYQTPVVTEQGVFSPGSVSTEVFKTPGDYKASKSDSIKSSFEDSTPRQEFKTPEVAEFDYDYSDYTNEYYQEDDDDNGVKNESTKLKQTPRNLTPRAERLRRSQILNKLNQVTSDIQNELQDFASDGGYEHDDYVSVFKDDDMANSFSKHSFNSRDSTESRTLLYDKNKSNSDNLNSYHAGDYEVGSGYGDILNQIEENYEYNPKDFSVTPLTSVNSLSNSKIEHMSSDSNTVAGTNSSISFSNFEGAKSVSSSSDKRKSKPVHEMFVPILGKFDELAERLAEIDEML